MSKKELEKRKKERKQEKQKRKENRKGSSTGSSLDDMIAYVDEFGNITDTPPEAVRAEKIELEDIMISTPKKEDIENEPLTGRVEFYNSEKGFGFIKDSESGEEVFTHATGLIDEIRENDEVTYDVTDGKKGPNAVNVKLA